MLNASSEWTSFYHHIIIFSSKIAYSKLSLPPRTTQKNVTQDVNSQKLYDSGGSRMFNLFSTLIFLENAPILSRPYLSRILSRPWGVFTVDLLPVKLVPLR